MTRLPPKSEEKVVDVSLRHVLIAFGVIAGSVVVTGTAMILIRDYSRFRRQKAIVDNLKELLILFNKENCLWKEKKTAG